MLPAATLALLIWLYLALAHGRFWQSGPELPPASAERESASIAVVIPARNEAEHILPTLQSLLAQQYVPNLHILLVDDNSTDATGSLARVLAASDERLTVLTGQPLPTGWTGKLWAVSQGLNHPLARAAEYVLLTDADIVHAPIHLAQLIAKAQTGRLDLVSEMVRLRTETLPERATIPAFVFFFAMLYPFAQVSDPRSRTAAAAGGTMLLSRAALDRIDGVHTIRAELIDDCALARAVKSSGGRLWLGHATQATSMRRYPAFADVWNMIARTAYVQLGYSPLILLGTVAGMLLLYALPVTLTLLAHGPARWIALTTWLLMAALFQPMLRRYRQSPLFGLALAFIALFYLAATVASALRFYQGRGGQWKDRTYPQT